jgi:flagellar hook-length control protein FliK
VVGRPGATPTVAAPAGAKPVDSESADGTTTDAAPVDPASLLAALGISLPPTNTAPASTSDATAGASLSAVAAGSEPGGQVDKRGQSLIGEAAPAVTALVDDKAAKFAVASASVEKTAAAEITATDSPALLASNASGGTHNVALKNDSTLSVATPVRDRDWATDVGQKIVWLATNDKHSAQLTLNPPQMGPIEISLSVDKGNASVSFISANAEVRDALETALPKLREMFASAGIELGQTNVSSESFRQQGGNGQPNQSSSRSTADNAILAGNTVASLQVKAFSAQQGNGLVNTFA